MSSLEKIFERARRSGRIDGGYVLCSNCDNPASKSQSEYVSWPVCAPCATDEAVDDGDLISVSELLSQGRPEVA